MKYNRDIFIANIRDVMREQGKRECDIVKETGISQTRVNLCLNKKAHFKLEEAAAVAEVLKCSLDELLGKQSERTEGIDNMSDILKMLFAIDEVTKVSVQTHYSMNEEVYGSSPAVIWFENNTLNGVMSDWDKFKKSGGMDVSFKAKMYDLWKEDQINNHKEYKVMGVTKFGGICKLFSKENQNRKMYTCDYL